MRAGNPFLAGALVAAAVCAAASSPALAGGPGRFSLASAGAAMRYNPGPLVQSYYYPSAGFGYYSPFVSVPSLSPPYPTNLPNYWWVGPYASEDPRQDGYNPSAGYDWGQITPLILTTSPAKAEVTLDGSAIGSADDLAPIQLPFGNHTVRVEAPGYEPSETVIQAKTPAVQRLQINLKSSRPVAAAMPPR
jgi:PEGA domain